MRAFFSGLFGASGAGESSLLGGLSCVDWVRGQEFLRGSYSWEFGGLAVWGSGGLVVWWSGGLVVWEVYRVWGGGRHLLLITCNLFCDSRASWARISHDFDKLD